MATNEQVTLITQTILSGLDAASNGRVTYLRALIDTTQEELGNKKGQEPGTQLLALEAVHKRFYEVVLAAADPFVPKGTKNRAVELHNKVNFARTAVSALRSHIKAGGDVAVLKGTTTKATLRTREGPPRPMTARRWKVRTERQSKLLMAALMQLADIDKQAAVNEMQLVLGQITSQLVSLGVISTTDQAVAVAEHRPLRVGKTLFVPTDTQVLRAQARAA